MTKARPTLASQSLIWAFTRAALLGGLLLCGLSAGAWYFATTILVQQEQLQASKVPQLVLAYQLTAATSDLQAESLLVHRAGSIEELSERQRVFERASDEIRLVLQQLLSEFPGPADDERDLLDQFQTIGNDMFSFRNRELQLMKTVTSLALSVETLFLQAQKDVRNTIVDLTDMVLAESGRLRQHGQHSGSSVAVDTLADSAWFLDSEKKVLLMQALGLINQELISLQALINRIPLITEKSELDLSRQRHVLLTNQLLARVVYLEDSEFRTRLLKHVSLIRSVLSADENLWTSQQELINTRLRASELREQLADNAQLILQHTEEITSSASESLLLAAEQSRVSMDNYRWYIVSSVLLGVIVVVSFCYRLLYLELVQPLVRLTERLKKIGTGDKLKHTDRYRFSELLDLSTAVSQLDEAQMTLQQQSKQLNKNNAELKRLNSDLEQFAHVASHDLQEPLRKLQQFSAVFREDYGEVLSGDGIMYLEVISDSAHRMRELISDTLQYSKAGLPQQTCEVVNVVKELRLVQQELELLVAQANASICVYELPNIYGSATGIKQLFRNLITNAIKYRREDTSPLIQIRSEIDVQTDEFLIHVEDNGLGVPPQFHERIFRPFERLVEKTVAGTGLGLAICKKVCVAHGWTIEIQSEEGGGSCFTIRGPRSSVAGFPVPGPSATDEKTQTAGWSGGLQANG